MARKPSKRKKIEEDVHQQQFIGDPVEYAQALGHKVYLRPGEMAFQELEISYLMACFKRRVYNDNNEVRARRHVLLDWENSWWKSSILNYFSWNCCGGQELTKSYRKYDKMYFINLCGDIKRPILRGSINRIAGKGGSERAKLVLPLMKYADLWIADELLDFLGEYNSEMYNYMLTVLEGGRGKVSMVSMVGAKISAPDRRRLNFNHIEFDSDLGMMSYWTKGTFWGGTRPIESKFLKDLWASGFLNRFVVVPWIPKVGEKEDALSIKLDPRKSNAEFLYNNNRIFWRTQFKRVETAPHYMWQEISSYTIEQFIRETSKSKIDYSPNPRDILHCTQLLSVSALINTVARKENENLLKGKGYSLKQQSLEYHPDDVKWSKPHIKRYIQMKTDFLLEVFKKLESEDTISKLYKEILSKYRQGSILYSLMVKDIIGNYRVTEIRAKQLLEALETLGFIQIIRNAKKKPDRIKILKESL